MTDELHELDVLHTPISRKKLLVLGGAAAGMLTAVGPQRAFGSGAGASGPTVKRGGTLKASYSDVPANIGTADWGLTGYTFGFAMFNRLLRQTRQGAIEPELAAGMPNVSKDGRTITFRLRKGVRFHNGAEVTADDVKFSIERAIDPKSGQQAQGVYSALGITGTKAFANGKAKEIVGLHVVDPHTIQVRLDHANGAVLGALCLPMASIVPKAYVQKIGNDAFEHKAPVGTGPYKLASLKPSESMVLERFDGYFDKSHAGYVDRIEFEFNVDPNLAILRIEKGQQDLMQNPVPAGMLASLLNNPSQKKNVVKGLVNNTFYATLSLKHPALKKLAVRQAIAYAIDKEKAVRQLGGVDRVADGGLFTGLSPYYQRNMGYPYNPDRAKALLTQAGYPNGFKIDVISQQPEPHRTLNESLTADLNAVGIQATSKPLPQSKFSPTVLKFGPWIVVNQWELAYPHGSYIIDSTFTADAIKAGCCNFSSFSEPAFDKLAARGRQARTRAEQVKLYKQMDKAVVREKALWVPLIYQGYATLKSSRLHGYKVPTLEGDILLFRDYWLS